MMISNTLLNRLLKLSLIWLSAFSLVASLTTMANDEPSPPISESAVKFTIVNPERNAGYLMGDFLDRTVTLEVKKPYKLVETTLPIVGY